MNTVIACGHAEGRVILAHLIIPWKTEKKLHGYDLESIESVCLTVCGPRMESKNSGLPRPFFQALTLNDHSCWSDDHNSHNNVEFLTLAWNNQVDDFTNASGVSVNHGQF